MASVADAAEVSPQVAGFDEQEAREQPYPHKPKVLEEGASIFSLISFWWANEFLKRGAEKTLTVEELPGLRAHLQSKVLSERLLAAWKKEGEIESEMKRKRKPGVRLLRAITRCFAPLHMLSQVLLVMHSASHIGQALALGWLVRYFSDESSEPWEGWVAASAVVLLGALYGILHHLYFFQAWMLGMQLRVVSTSLVFRKILQLRVSSLGDASMSLGFIINLATADIERFQLAGIFVMFLFTAPLEAFVVLILGIHIVGPSFLAGFAALLFLVPLQAVFSKRFGQLRSQVTILADERVKLTNQAVTGARLMKISGWEGPLTDAIRNAREREVGAMQKATFLRACNEALFFIQPTVLSLLTFTTYVATGNELTPAKVFTTIALLNLTQFSVGKFLFLSVQGCSEAWVSIKRLEKLFLLDENDGFSFIGDDPDVFGEEEDALPNPAPMLGSEPSSMSRISLTNSSFRWTSQAQLSTKEVEAEGENEDSDSEDSNDKHEAGRGNGATLQDIQLEVMDGELVGVAGPVAAAKSSLLLAVLREMVPESDSTGHHHVLGRIAYASQEPWIQGGRLRDNILFGQKFDKQRYWRVVNACALGPDLESLPYGDSTIIGDRGVNLSGGQKARVGLARLAYADADVYLLDDPLSAVDPGVGKHLFHSVICGLLKGKTRVLVTHQTQYLQDVDRVIIMRGGRITAQGKWDELSAAGSLAGVIAVSAMETLPGVDDLATQELTEALPQRENGMGEHGEKETADNDGPRSRASTILSAPETGAEILNRGKSVEAQVEEQQQSGNVSLSTYRQYVNAAAGPALGIVMVVLLVAGQALTMLVFLLLAKWSQAADYKDAWWMWSFILVCLLAIIMSFLRATVTFHSLLRSSKQLHNRMLERVVRAPVSFFDLNSSGIILNRFAKDIAYMDDMLPMTVYDFITCLFMVLGTIILVVVVNFWVVLALVPSIFIFYYLLKFYLKTSREVKRLEAKTRSPLYTFLSESLDGLVTIRAFGAQKRFLEEFSARLDLNTRAFYAFIFTARWLGFRLDVIVILILSAACFISVALNEFASDKVNAGLLGVALVYVIQLGGLFQWAVRQAAEVENQIVSVERVLQYCELEQEAALYSKPGKEPPENWPDKGSIEVEDLWASYRPGLPPVLKGLTFNISPGTVVGIVGRTGAGKSSLVSTLFRLLEYDASKGFIAIDGIKTCEVGLHELRPRLSVIPQTPFLFSGTFRQNLDPFLKRSDAQIWAALEAVQLSAYIAAQPGGLSTLMTENGGNLSSGQRQLVCLARAILQRSTVLVLDEATANIDVQTDQLISSAIRANFKGCTVIIIAHRLHTIIDADEVIVLSEGKVLEKGEPHSLLAEGGAFFAMVQETGEATAQNLSAAAREAHAQRRDSILNEHDAPL